MFRKIMTQVVLCLFCVYTLSSSPLTKTDLALGQGRPEDQIAQRMKSDKKLNGRSVEKDAKGRPVRITGRGDASGLEYRAEIKWQDGEDGTVGVRQNFL